MKRLVVIWILCVAMMSTFAIADTSSRTVFECSVSQMMNFSILIDQDKDRLIFNESIATRNQLSQWIRPQDYHVEHYHRALVDEKPLELRIGERVILVSEYLSEEFNEVEKILSVTLKQSGQTQHFECEEGSISHFASLFQESTD